METKKMKGLLDDLPREYIERVCDITGGMNGYPEPLEGWGIVPKLGEYERIEAMLENRGVDYSIIELHYKHEWGVARKTHEIHHLGYEFKYQSEWFGDDYSVYKVETEADRENIADQCLGEDVTEENRAKFIDNLNEGWNLCRHGDLWPDELAPTGYDFDQNYYRIAFFITDSEITEE